MTTTEIRPQVEPKYEEYAPEREPEKKSKLFLFLVLGALALNMYRRRYWAVLGFEALLAFQIIVTSLALVVASTIAAALICTVGVVLGGWLFWKLVGVMGRIQAGERRDREHSH